MGCGQCTCLPASRWIGSARGVRGGVASRGLFGAFVLWRFRGIFVQNSLKRRITMAEEKAIEKDKEPKKGQPEVEDDLSDKDVEKVAGGMKIEGCITFSDSSKVC